MKLLAFLLGPVLALVLGVPIGAIAIATTVVAGCGR